HERSLAIVRPRRPFYAAQLVVGAPEVEGLLAGPEPLDDGPPLLALLVASLVLERRQAEHPKLVFVPAADDVQAQTPLANVIRRGDLLRGGDRVIQWHVDRAKDVDPLRGGQQAAGPGDRFEAGAVRVRLTPVALPAR